MLIAITSNGKIGLAVLAGLLIVFALLSSFYFPRRNPDFPGNRLGLFIVAAVLFFLGTMAGVVYFAKEEEHAEACLLYTSPSPRDLSTSRMPSSA